MTFWAFLDKNLKEIGSFLIVFTMIFGFWILPGITEALTARAIIAAERRERREREKAARTKKSVDSQS